MSEIGKRKLSQTEIGNWTSTLSGKVHVVYPIPSFWRLHLKRGPSSDRNLVKIPFQLDHRNLRQNSNEDQTCIQLASSPKIHCYTHTPRKLTTGWPKRSTPKKRNPENHRSTVNLQFWVQNAKLLAPIYWAFASPRCFQIIKLIRPNQNHSSTIHERVAFGGGMGPLDSQKTYIKHRISEYSPKKTNKLPQKWCF